MSQRFQFNLRAAARLPFWMVASLLISAAIVRADEAQKAAPTDPFREAYREDAEKCEFSTADGQPIELVKEPLMRWMNDGNWSGDVFVWTHEGRPEVIGCMLSGPGAGKLRYVWHEFHLLAEKPIAPAVIQNGRRWEPAEGLKTEPVPDAPQPAKRGTARLVQMREIARGFQAYMWTGKTTELRLLPQPLMRYGDDKGEVLDGALFAYVWTLGTDPELILLVECRRDDGELTWCFAPVRFSNRGVWLKHGEKDVWGVKGHSEPKGKTTTLIYTTGFARSMPSQEKSESNRGSSE